MTGVRKLRKLQLGAESVAGTAVPTTAIWRGAGLLEDTREIKVPDEDVGLLAPTARAYVPFLGGKLALDDVEATFEQLPYILAAGVDGSVDGVKDGAGSGYEWQYDFATTAQKAPQTYTIQAGDNQQVEVMEHCFVEGFKLSGAPKEAWKMSADWIGRQVQPGAFTAGLELASVEEMLFGRTKLYIDDATIGTSIKSATLMGCSLDVKKSGFAARATANGEIYFDRVEQSAPEITLEITFEHDGAATAEKAKWRSGAERLVRLECAGSSLSSAGTHTTKLLRIDVAGVWDKFAKLDEMDGNDVVKGTLRVAYDSASQLLASILVVNELAALQ